MSFPPGTEMFQFPGFASHAYVFSMRSSYEGVAPFGYPWIKACSRLPMAFRSVPRPSSPPGAKASTECPSVVQSRHTYRHEINSTAYPPCTGTIHRINPNRKNKIEKTHQCARTGSNLHHASEHSEPFAYMARSLRRSPGQTTLCKDPDQTS